MPSTVTDLFESAGLRLAGGVRWKTPVPVQGSGVYVVSLSDNPSQGNGIVPRAPIDPPAVAAWLERVPLLQIDRVKCADFRELCDRLTGFWLGDENIVYIGKATSLQSRVGAFYRTPLGDRGPHAGGHWIKTLASLDTMRVYFAETSAFEDAEQILLAAFLRGTSAPIRKGLFDPALPLPFANLEFPPG